MKSFGNFVPLVILLVAHSQSSPISIAHGPIMSTDDDSHHGLPEALGSTLHSLPLIGELTHGLPYVQGSVHLGKRVNLPLIGEVGSSIATPFNALKDEITPVASGIASKVGGFFSGLTSFF